MRKDRTLILRVLESIESSSVQGSLFPFGLWTQQWLQKLDDGRFVSEKPLVKLTISKADSSFDLFVGSGVFVIASTISDVGSTLSTSLCSLEPGLSELQTDIFLVCIATCSL